MASEVAEFPQTVVEIESRALALASTREEVLVITSPEIMVEVDTEVVDLKAFERMVEAHYKPIKAVAKAAHTKVCEEENKILGIIGGGKKIRLDAIQAFRKKVEDEEKRRREEQERLARLEQARLVKKAKDDQELQETESLVPQLEALGYKIVVTKDPSLGCVVAVDVELAGVTKLTIGPTEFITRARAAIAKDIEAKRLAKIEKDRLEQAEKLEKEGKTEEAMQVISAPIPEAPPPAPVPPPPPPPIQAAPAVASYAPPPLPKTSGYTGRKNWKGGPKGGPDYRRDAVLALIQAAAKEPDRYAHFLDLNDKAIDLQAKQTEDRVAFPGLEFFNQPTR